MLFNQATFLTSATNSRNLPKTQLPEIAFIGRSNVGKSSLINAIIGNAKMAKTSKTPGRTQQINFFKLPELIIVDLPGYGYASAPIKEVQKWQEFNLEYMKNRQQLKLVFILVDSRIGFKELDLNLIEQLNEVGVKCRIIYTKVDKLNKSEIEILKSITTFNDKYPLLDPNALIASSKNKEGIEKIRKVILHYKFLEMN
ncbi:MAG: ribosome biogenesis GTP-binding protein YihA/YsxC [Candidatus Midichloria sp.]|uniref:YihA family ribosome biogenesis GTP-binding protein n=1 Tax=Hyalomma marginatum TaxID=34627 RepID=A0A8S4C1N9_9ACAR|nr:YihA family ribosome biogenesis GTP-binding protein [Hyalomma marginatum]CAG7590962.1 YihA family ribosome biogenesis GTP-binding protein [Hyalomma marginatum]